MKTGLRAGKADIRNPLSLLAHERSRFTSCQWELLTPTDISIPLTHRLVLYALEAGECLFCVHILLYLLASHNARERMISCQTRTCTVSHLRICNKRSTHTEHCSFSEFPLPWVLFMYIIFSVYFLLPAFLRNSERVSPVFRLKICEK